MTAKSFMTRIAIAFLKRIIFRLMKYVSKRRCHICIVPWSRNRPLCVWL